MSATPCPRLFEAEALRDGRLAGAERASFERHVTACPACSREVRALEALGESLRAGVPERPAADELHARRERTRLLAAFDRALVGPRRSQSLGRRLLLWPAAMAAIFVAAVVVLPRLRRPSGAPGHASNAVIHADSATVWTDRVVGNVENVVLERGALWIQVDHSLGEGRLLVVLPDGELEDTGTTFTVSADDGRTARVAVQEGHVVLRLRGQAAIALGPGDMWTPEPRPVASAMASVAPPADLAPVARLEIAPRSAPSPRPSAPLAPRPAADSSIDFRAAMAEFEAGDNARAADAFSAFLEKHPRDPRSEDAAYLRIVALQRAGDSAGMTQAALDYLHRYPAGFRQAEVEPLSR